jgi:glutaminase
MSTAPTDPAPGSARPLVEAVEGALERVLDEARLARGGAVADYIPELARANPEHLAVAVASVGGNVYGAGDDRHPFTIQSISKPFVYALAVRELGFDEVAGRVGFEPSGEPFNAISLEPGTGRPANPMINAGAIVTSALVPGPTPAERFERIRAGLSAFAGRQLEVDERTFASERATGDRNRALGYLTLATGILPLPVDDAVDAYFRQCSVLVTARDLAVMGATLAHAGVNPVTGEAVVDPAIAKRTLSVMATCGMYDYSGEWLVRVGLPAKSGVGGGVLAAQPGQVGIGVFSPPLDGRGNSVRGVEALVGVSQAYELHLFDHLTRPRSAIESVVVGPDGDVVVTLRGEVDFIAAEQLVDELRGHAGEARSIRVDARAVTDVRAVAARFLAVAAGHLRAGGLDVVVDGLPG